MSVTSLEPESEIVDLSILLSICKSDRDICYQDSVVLKCLKAWVEIHYH